MKQYFKSKSNVVHKVYKWMILLIAILLIGHFLIENSSINYRKTWHWARITNNLNQYDLVLINGERFRLFVYGFDKGVSYTSTNFRVAEVDFLGQIYTFQPGKTFIKVKVGGHTLKCRVRVIDINKEQLNLKVGQSYKLKIRGIVSTVKWKSGNPEVASVSWTGRVKALKRGRATITATVKGKVLKCTVNVD